jgi:two-component system phosphate regulon sensor histidine kinase PhoR
MASACDNLVSNAIKYNTENGIVMVSISETDDTVTLRVADTGIGMSAEEQKGLFEKFYRADSVRQSSVHGTGLGLNITRNIIEQHNGQVQVESIPGEGTTIIVTLPRQAVLGA